GGGNPTGWEIFGRWTIVAGRLYKNVIDTPDTPDAVFAALGLVKPNPPGKGDPPVIDGKQGVVSRIEIGSVRPAWHLGDTGEIVSNGVVGMSQRRKPDGSGMWFP